MNASTRNRCVGTNSFIVCFYCNETFRSLSSLNKHRCSEEGKISLDWEPREIVSEVDDVDLSQPDWEMQESISDKNNDDLGQEDSVSSESVSEKPSDFISQAIIESELKASNFCENSLPETDSEQPLSETKSNAEREEIPNLPSDIPEKQLLEANLVVIREENTELSSDASEKQSSDANLDVVREQQTELSSDVSEKQSSVANSDAIEKITEPFDASEDKQLSVANSCKEQKIAYVKHNTYNECDGISLDLVNTVLQYYEKQTKQDSLDSCGKSPSAEIEFQSSHSPLPKMEPSSPRHNTQMECTATDVVNNSLSSEAKCIIYEEVVIQQESDVLKQNAESFESHDSNMYSRPSSPEIDSSDMYSRSSSIGGDLDSLGCIDDQVESNVSNLCNALFLSEQKSSALKQDDVQMESCATVISGKSLLQENLNITKYGSVILKPCYVKVQDIFKSLSNSKLSPEKIFSRKKKYHVCDVCYKFFRLRSDLSIHYLSHTCNKPFMCTICGKSFIKQCNLFAHHLSHTTKKHHVCSLCKKPFLKKSLLLRHKLTHTKEKPYACDKCNKSYSVKSSLTEHYLSHSEERPFICEICSASFNNKRYLRKHYYTHKKEENVCQFCFKTFKRKHHLDDHYNIHVNDKPYQCKFCSKSFHMLLTLNKHYSVSHRNERDLIVKKSVKNLVECKTSKDPIIQKIEKSVVTVNSETTPVKKIEKISDDHKSKEMAPYITRRKSFTPKKYMQPDSIVFY